MWNPKPFPEFIATEKASSSDAFHNGQNTFTSATGECSVLPGFLPYTIRGGGLGCIRHGGKPSCQTFGSHLLKPPETCYLRPNNSRTVGRGGREIRHTEDSHATVELQAYLVS